MAALDVAETAELAAEVDILLCKEALVTQVLLLTVSIVLKLAVEQIVQQAMAVTHIQAFTLAHVVMPEMNIDVLIIAMGAGM